MKKHVNKIIIILLLLTFLASCSAGKTTSEDKETICELKVILITDSSDVQDGRFNEETWNQIKQTAEELGCEYGFYEPGDSETSTLLKVIDEQYNAGYNVFILPGGLFWGSVVYEAQGKYEDAKFVLIDGLPNPGDPEEVSINTNTVAVTFDVSKSGFLAGFSTALELKNAEIGFIGGAPIPDVQMYNWGFQQGVIYANENYGTQCSMKAENWVYQGTFHETEAGRALAADMFDRGVKAIFCVAGPVGRAAIEEAKDRAMQEQKVYAIGADFDQYQMGIYAEDDSVLLTSATKGYGKAAHDAIVDLCEGNFRGGQEIVISGGIPQVNPNLSKDTFDIVEDVSEKIKSGNIQVLNVQGDLLP